MPHPRMPEGVPARPASAQENPEGGAIKERLDRHLHRQAVRGAKQVQELGLAIGFADLFDRDARPRSRAGIVRL